MPERSIELIERARRAAGRTAVVAPEGQFSYADLLDASDRATRVLLGGRPDLDEARVAFLAPGGWHYVVALWGIWRAGGMAVPLKMSAPAPQIEYVIDDSKADTVIAYPQYEATLRPIAEKRGLRFLTTSQLLEANPSPQPSPARGEGATGALPHLAPDRWAVLLYTSGTTSLPKGVIITHANIEAQVRSLTQAWAWTQDDRILLFLPLDHIHGLVNVLTCALWSGATCEMLPAFDAARVWDRVCKGGLSLFMAVPDVYSRLIAAWEAAPPARQRAMSDACRAMRLMVSGSSALPVPRLEAWRNITGHTLLERYGMTEIGMALSNPLHDERKPGYVGTPLPGVSVRLVDEHSAPVPDGTPGEIQVRGGTVFAGYWDRSLATRRAFRDGWFCTGDMAVVEGGAYRILGRLSTDIIKSGGEKVSALEIEPVLLRHPSVADCAVVGVPDEKWGEAVTAAVVLRPGCKLTLAELRDFARQHLAPASIPTRLELMDALPRNAMGKTLKPDLRRVIEERAR